MDVMKYPVNRDAVRLLKQANQTVDLEILPALQLAWWGARNGLDVTVQTMEQIEALMRSDQDWAMEWVLGKIPGEPLRLQSYLKKTTDPLAGAWRVIDEIETVKITRT